VNILTFEHNIGFKELERQLYDACHMTTPLGLPALFHFEGSIEKKVIMCMYPNKLADLIHKNLGVFADRGWTAVMHIDEVGFTHVFFGKNEGVLELPDVFNQPIAGTC